jgi:hypothetical protein
LAYRFKNAPPANEADFERLSLRLLKAYWSCPTLELLGRRGERQDGIDILDTSGDEPLKAAQCKLYDPNKTLPPSEIEAEINAAKGFPFPLGIYGLLTTARVSVQAQKTIIAINRKHRKQGLFRVQLFTWDQIDELLEEFTSVRDQLYKTLSAETAEQIMGGITEIRSFIAVTAIQIDSTTKGTTDTLHLQIDEARAQIQDNQPQIARFLLQRLRTHSWDKMNPRHRFRVLSNLGAAYMQERDFALASQFFIDAGRYQPDDVQAAENVALAHCLSLPREKAFEEVGRIKQKFPASAKITAFWISHAPIAWPKEQVEAGLDPTQVGSPEILTALAERSLIDCQFEDCELYRVAQLNNSRIGRFPANFAPAHFASAF